MRVRKRGSLVFALTVCVVAVFCIHPSHGIDLPEAGILKIAASEAVRRFGDRSTAHFLETFYDVRGTPAVHLFLITKNRESIPEDVEESIQQARRLREQAESMIYAGITEEGEELLATATALLFQEDQFGALLFSADEPEPFLVAFHHGLPTSVVAEGEAEQEASIYAQGGGVTRLGVLYFSPFEYYYEFDVAGERILLSPFDSSILSRAEMERSLQSSSDSAFERPGEVLSDTTHRNLSNSQEVNETSSNLSGNAAGPQIIPVVPDYNQRPSLPNSCGPTAGACLLGYWDTQGYDDLLRGEGTHDDVTHLIEELCDTMNWDPSTGVYYSRLPIGLRDLTDNREYAFDVSTLYSIDSLDTVTEEIDATRPFVYGSQENPWGCSHYVIVVGYDGNFIIVHDNWWSTPEDYYVNWDALGHSDDMMTLLIPQGEGVALGETLPSGIGGGGGGGCFIQTTMN
jgi:hypothetical protein